jgi:sortase (surface protein transpeptidase)
MDLSAPEKPGSNLKERFAKVFSKSPRWGAFASLVLIAAGAVLLINYFAGIIFVQNPILSTEVLEPAVIGQTMPRSAPVRLKIPDIGVNAPFVELALAPNNEIQTPKSFTDVGWYVNGPTPGELGPAIILGHVDSKAGPAVFFSLGQLDPGDTIEVQRQDGSTAIFRVDKLERYPQSSFPTSLVYGDIDHAGLRLITCSGSYDRQAKRYNMNLVVYASLIDTK